MGAAGDADALGWEMATCSCILAQEIPWTEKPGGLPPIGCKEATEHTQLRRCKFYLWLSRSQEKEQSSPNSQTPKSGPEELTWAITPLFRLQATLPGSLLAASKDTFHHGLSSCISSLTTRQVSTARVSTENTTLFPLLKEPATFFCTGSKTSHLHLASIPQPKVKTKALHT